jgi:hypothetical protein
LPRSRFAGPRESLAWRLRQHDSLHDECLMGVSAMGDLSIHARDGEPRILFYRWGELWRFAGWLDEGTFSAGNLPVEPDAPETVAIEAAQNLVASCARPVAVTRGTDRI